MPRFNFNIVLMAHVKHINHWTGFLFFGFFFFFFFFFVFLGPHLGHVEVPRLGVESELQQC